MPVFLSNVDDYLAPSQACVNPLFADGVNAKKGDDGEEKKEPDDVGIVPRKRTIRRKGRKPTAAGIVPTRDDTAEPKETAKVSMVDCLACSGCVTSAETVLVEQHSLQTLHEKLQSAAPSTKVVVTISPASWADVVRHLQLPDTADRGLVRRKLATALHQTCRASIVLDAHVPLQWSWQEAAREFCHAYQEAKQQQQSIATSSIQTPLPSMAVSSTQSQRYDGTVTTHTARSVSHLPLLSATCPALVCLVEKSHPSIVPHLSTTKSPMAMAGAYIKSSTTTAAAGSDILHIAIMPCHDKKLEASRKDFLSNEEIPDVDLVLTSNEWIELMAQAAASDGANGESSNDVDAIRTYVESLEPTVSVSSLQQQHILGENGKAVLVESYQATSSDVGDPMEVDGTSNRAANDFFSYGSGGYADFIFRYAAKHLFGFEIHSPFLPWKPVSSSNGTAPKIVSARVAASRKKDYHAVTLYQLQDGTYSMSSDAGATTVLRFATAYGFQTLQRILQPMDNRGAAALEFDYVEAMACPSGCINGGGQVRLTERETPKETRQRVSETRRQFQLTYDDMSSVNNDDVYQTDSGSSGPFGAEAQLRLHTRYHVVPALQHSLGAAAGVAVQDTQW
eukprot:CAMPEP_0119006520 /NCGR_PEP_ID=MMETSP1176-20130426/2334_1 /TAXON_ID=265551 /ORGANISM="Synedropsis recta cf, Strain CCMP1620" /LENGTH=620 /DNA_ID=CAMNT_0006958435 /DNA_START=11 /DNA_END=1873 /DNA_ORIENTATION=-